MQRVKKLQNFNDSSRCRLDLNSQPEHISHELAVEGTQATMRSRVVFTNGSQDPWQHASKQVSSTNVTSKLKNCSSRAAVNKVERGHTILVHAATSGVGSLLSQWTDALGVTVTGTVSTKEKAAQVMEYGCQHIIINKEERFVKRVLRSPQVKGLEVVYDSVGKDTFELDLLNENVTWRTSLSYMEQIC
nr:hypothetical protein [Tanacetum cinerariifolium]